MEDIAAALKAKEDAEVEKAKQTAQVKAASAAAANIKAS